MSEIKTIMEYFVRRVFGNANNLPADAASGTLLDHLLRIKDNIKVAYDWLHQRLDKDFLPTTTLQTENTDNLLSNLQKLDNRKISNDSLNDGIDDGVSLVRLLCSDAAASVTELKDDNEGWKLTKSNAFTIFPSATSINLNCGYATRCIAKGNSLLTKVLTPSLIEVNNDIQADGFITNCVNVEEVDFSSLEKFYCRYDNAPLTSVAIGPIKGSEVIEFPRLQSAYVKGNCKSVFVFTETKVLKFPELTTIPYIGNATWLQSCPMLEELYMPKFGVISSAAGWPTLLANLPKLKKLVIGVTAETTKNSGSLLNLTASTELVDFRIGEGQNSSMNIKTWNPTSVLSDSERLPIFLSNFQTYIADRVVDRTGKTALTLTLSAAVYEALQAQEGQTILATLTNKNWNVAQA